jgi:hypothetical protein
MPLHLLAITQRPEEVRDHFETPELGKGFHQSRKKKMRVRQIFQLAVNVVGQPMRQGARRRTLHIGLAKTDDRIDDEPRLSQILQENIARSERRQRLHRQLSWLEDPSWFSLKKVSSQRLDGSRTATDQSGRREVTPAQGFETLHHLSDLAV